MSNSSTNNAHSSSANSSSANSTSANSSSVSTTVSSSSTSSSSAGLGSGPSHAGVKRKWVSEEDRSVLVDSLSSIRSNEELIDVTIVCKERRFPAHKLVLAAYSPVFKAMVSLPFKENSESEVHMNDVEPETVEAMLTYFYRGGLYIGEAKNDEKKDATASANKKKKLEVNTITSIAEMVSLFQLLLLAHKYDIDCLLNFCKRSMVAGNSKTVIDFLHYLSKLGLNVRSLSAVAQLQRKYVNVVVSDSRRMNLFRNHPKYGDIMSDSAIRDLIVDTLNYCVKEYRGIFVDVYFNGVLEVKIPVRAKDTLRVVCAKLTSKKGVKIMQNEKSWDAWRCDRNGKKVSENLSFTDNMETLGIWPDNDRKYTIHFTFSGRRYNRPVV